MLAQRVWPIGLQHHLQCRGRIGLLVKDGYRILASVLSQYAPQTAIVLQGTGRRRLFVAARKKCQPEKNSQQVPRVAQLVWMR